MLCKSFPLFILFLYLLAFIHLSSSFSLSGYELIDLEESSNSLFQADAVKWESTFPQNNENRIFSFCQGFPFLGGYLTDQNNGGAYLQREYNDIPKHDLIHFSFILWIEGDWNSAPQDLFKLSFNYGSLQALNIQRYIKGDALCKSIEDKNVFKVDGTVHHNEPSLIFGVITQPSTLEGQIMFGIRELNFTLIPTSSYNADLDPEPDSHTSQIRNLLELPSTSYSKERMTQSVTCDSTCGTCSGTTANDCITCPSGRFLRVLGSGVSFCAPSYYPEFKDFINYVVLTPPDKSGQPCLAVLANTMQYVRYLDMEMPASLTRLAIGQGRSILSIRYGMHMPDSLVEHFVWYPLEDVFTRQGLHSSFLVNYWQEITSFGIIIVAVLIFTICEQVCKMGKWRIATTVFETLRVMTRCNLLLVLLTTSFGDIILFGSFEFRTFYHSFDAGSTYASFFVFVFMLVIITCHFALLVIIERKGKQAITVGFQEQTFFGKIRQEFQVLYTSFHWTTVIGRLFMLVYMVRVGLPMLFSAYVYVSPLAQVIIDLLINIAILVIIGYFRPFKKKINMIQIVLFETMVFIMNICMLVVTIISVYGTAEGQSFETCGNIVVIGNVLIQLFMLIFLIIKVILEMRIILSLKHLSTEEKIIAWLQLLFLILQQGGMGFEMISEGPAADFQDQFSQNLGAPTLNNTTNMALQTSMQYKRGAIIPFPNINDSKPVGNGRNTNRSHDNSYINSIEMRDGIEPQFNSPTNYRNNTKNLSARSQRGTVSKGFQSRRKDPGSPPRGIRKPGTRYGDGTLTVSMNITDSPILYEEGVGQPHRVSFTHREPSDSRIVYSEEPPVMSYGDWATKRGSKNKILDLYYSMRNTTGKLASNGRARKVEHESQPRSTSIRGSAKVAPWFY